MAGHESWWIEWSKLAIQRVVHKATTRRHWSSSIPWAFARHCSGWQFACPVSPVLSLSNTSLKDACSPYECFWSFLPSRTAIKLSPIRSFRATSRQVRPSWQWLVVWKHMMNLFLDQITRMSLVSGPQIVFLWWLPSWSPILDSAEKSWNPRWLFLTRDPPKTSAQIDYSQRRWIQLGRETAIERTSATARTMHESFGTQRNEHDIIEWRFGSRKWNGRIACLDVNPNKQTNKQWEF